MPDVALLFLGKDEFIERVMLCQITESTRTAERLFKVLTANSGEKRKHIDLKITLECCLKYLHS